MFLSFFPPLIEGVPLEGDDPEHIQWIFQKSLERASQYNIRGVTYRLTQGKLVICNELQSGVILFLGAGNALEEIIDK